MRTLKTFDSFMDNKMKEILQEVEDILVELRDKDFNTKVKFGNNWIQIFITRRNNIFTYSDIEDTVERIKSYLDEEDFLYSGRNEGERSTGRPIISTSDYYNPMNFEADGISTYCSMVFINKDE